MLPGDVDLEVGRDSGLAAGLGPAAVGLDAHEVDRERRVDAADEVGEEEERARGDADDDRGLRQRAQVGRELGATSPTRAATSASVHSTRSMPASALTMTAAAAAAATGRAARVVGRRRARSAGDLLGRRWCAGGGVGVTMLRGWEDAGLVGNRARAVFGSPVKKI